MADGHMASSQAMADHMAKNQMGGHSAGGGRMVGGAGGGPGATMRSPGDQGAGPGGMMAGAHNTHCPGYSNEPAEPKK